MLIVLKEEYVLIEQAALYRQTGRQTDRQTDRQTGFDPLLLLQIVRGNNMQAGRRADRQPGSQGME